MRPMTPLYRTAFGNGAKTRVSTACPSSLRVPAWCCAKPRPPRSAAQIVHLPQQGCLRDWLIHGAATRSEITSWPAKAILYLNSTPVFSSVIKRRPRVRSSSVSRVSICAIERISSNWRWRT